MYAWKCALLVHLFIYYLLPCWSCQQGPVHNCVHQRQYWKQGVGGAGVRKVTDMSWSDWVACVSKGGMLWGGEGVAQGRPER